MTEAEGAPGLARLMAALDRGPLGDVLRDDHRRRAAVYERMAASSDPLTREIGQQLRDGVLRPQDLLKDPEYRRFLDRGVERLRELDLDELTRQAEAAAEAAGAEAAGAEAAGAESAAAAAGAEAAAEAAGQEGRDPGEDRGTRAGDTPPRDERGLRWR
jgi:hypothetical protein